MKGAQARMTASMPWKKSVSGTSGMDRRFAERSMRRQLVVRSGQPVLARRAEHVHVERVLEGERAVREERWDHDDLAGAHRELLGAVLAEPEMQRPLEHVGDLLVLVRVSRHVIVLLE